MKYTVVEIFSAHDTIVIGLNVTRKNRYMMVGSYTTGTGCKISSSTYMCINERYNNTKYVYPAYCIP